MLGEPIVTCVSHTPASVFTDTLAAHVIAGASTSVTVTSCVQLVVFPEPSVTVHVTVVVPSGYTSLASEVPL